MPNRLTIKQARDGLKAGEFSSLELTKACLKRIKERNKEINAFITVSEDIALEEAKKSDELIKKNKSGALCGIPFCVKDAICVNGVRATAAAKILDNYFPPYEATVIKKIRKNGAVIVGKNNCDTFGHGASNENSMYGAVKNPHDLKKVAGGSSGGTAAAVADNMCIFGVGEDTGGSIRQPASLCGILGLRPTYGRNSRYGIMPMASSLDTVGPLAKTVEDIAILMEIMAGRDEKDATTLQDSVPKYAKDIKKSLKGMKLGIPKEYFELEGMDAETKKIIEDSVKKLEMLGCKIKSISLPHTKYALPVYYIIVPSEDSSNMGRIDAIRYGVREERKSLYGTYSESRSRGLSEEVKRRIMIGTYALSAGYYDAYYRKAQKVRTLIIKDFETAFTDIDAIITPTSPFPAFEIGSKVNDVLAMYLADVFVSPSAVAGLPALSVPAGMTKKNLPVGLQIIGPRLGEPEVLKIGHNFEINNN